MTATKALQVWLRTWLHRKEPMFANDRLAALKVITKCVRLLLNAWAAMKYAPRLSCSELLISWWRRVAVNAKPALLQ
jgi:hypothetical protein